MISGPPESSVAAAVNFDNAHRMEYVAMDHQLQVSNTHYINTRTHTRTHAHTHKYTTKYVNHTVFIILGRPVRSTL